jgi:hypothetical protein
VSAHYREQLLFKTLSRYREVKHPCLGMNIWGKVRIGLNGYHKKAESVIELYQVVIELNVLVFFDFLDFPKYDRVQTWVEALTAESFA